MRLETGASRVRPAPSSECGGAGNNPRCGGVPHSGREALGRVNVGRISHPQASGTPPERGSQGDQAAQAPMGIITPEVWSDAHTLNQSPHVAATSSPTRGECSPGNRGYRPGRAKTMEDAMK